MAHETQQSITEWGLKTFGKPRREALVTKFHEEVHELLETILSARRLKTKRKQVAVEAADLHIVLVQICSAYGVQLDLEVDAKMIINRQRNWILTSKGIGKHRKGD